MNIWKRILAALIAAAMLVPAAAASGEAPDGAAMVEENAWSEPVVSEPMEAEVPEAGELCLFGDGEAAAEAEKHDAGADDFGDDAGAANEAGPDEAVDEDDPEAWAGLEPVDRTVTLTADAEETANVKDTLRLFVGIEGVTVKKWTTSKKKVATASFDKQTGECLVKPVGEGVTKLTATLNKNSLGLKKLTVTLTVSDPWLPTSVEFKGSKTLTTHAGEETELTGLLSLAPVYLDKAELTWKSSRATVAKLTVSGGKVTLKALKAGKAKITVSGANKKKDVLSVVVEPNKVDNMSLKADALAAAKTLGEGWTLWPLSIEINKAGNLDCRFYLINGSSQKGSQLEMLTLTLAAGERDNIVARGTFSQVKASASKQGVKLLKLTLTAQPALKRVFLPEHYRNGTLYFNLNRKQVVMRAKKDSVPFIPTKFPVPVTGISLSETNATLRAGDTLTLTAGVAPAEATEPAVVWTSDKPAVARVEGGVVTAVAEGSANILATALDDDSVRAICAVTVLPGLVPVTDIGLDRDDVRLWVGEKWTLKPTVRPADASDKGLAWQSSAPEVAAVDEYGQVTALAGGKAVITASATDDPAVKASCAVTVAVPVGEISLSAASVALMAGKTLTLTAEALPVNAYDRSIRWSSDRPDLATVDDAGLVTAVAAGEGVATITAEAADGRGAKATCAIRVTDNTVAVTGISLDRSGEAMKVGQTLTLKAALTPEDASNKDVAWSSSNPAVASVAGGLVTALSAGEAVITASAEENPAIKVQCKIVVSAADVPVKGVSLSLAQWPAEAGDTVTLTASVSPENATNREIVWSSSNPAVASVADGAVTALSEGTAVITAASAENGDISASCAVTVAAIPVPVSEIELSVGGAALLVGETLTLTAAALPGEASDKAIRWISSAPAVASVADGTVTALSEGEAEIAAEAADGGGARAVCRVSVSKPTRPVKGILMDKSAAGLKAGEALALHASVLPGDASVPGILWTSSDAAVAKVDADGLVTAIAAGEAVITATSAENGFIQADCAVTVAAADVPVKGVGLDRTGADLWVGGSLTLTASVSPANASNPGVVWSSSDETVAKVDADGAVTAIAPGAATITAASAENPSVKAECLVNVSVAVSAIDLSATGAALTVGETLMLTAAVSPAGAANGAVKWTSSDAAVAKVDDGGTVTAVKAGTAVVTATAADGGGATAACAVTVSDAATPAKGLALKPARAELKVGETLALSAAFTPADPSDKALVWATGDAAVATVADGVVTAVAPGTVTITAALKANGGLAAACQVTVSAVDVPATGVRLNRSAADMKPGDALTLTASIEPADATDQALIWTSDKPECAAVKGGAVTALAPGRATITAASAANGAVKATCEVTVTGIAVSPAGAALTVGEALTLQASATPDGSGITWTSSAPDIASVDAAGGVKALKAGAAVITATADRGGASASCSVTVTDPPAQAASLTLDRRRAVLPAGGALTLKATASPETALVWTSSDENVVTVSGGALTAVGPGRATVTAASAYNGAVSVRCDVYVAGIAMADSASEVMAGNALALKAEASPDAAAGLAVVWSSDHPEYARVSADGAVTGVAPGKAAITAALADNSAIKVTREITVTAAPVPVAGIALSPAGASLTVGQALTLSADVQPADAANRSLAWDSSDAAVAKYENGEIQALSAGTAVITASAQDGSGAQASITVTVAAPAVRLTGLSLDRVGAVLGAGDSLALTAAVKASGTPTNPKLTWTTGDESVATVAADQSDSAKATVTAVGTGRTTITAASVENPGMAVTCEITVAEIAWDDSNTYALSEGEALTLQATATPALDIMWSSATPGVASVNQSGAVTGVSAGTAAITAALAANPQIKVEHSVTVAAVQHTPATGVELSAASASLNAGETLTLTAAVKPDEASQAVVWQSSAPAVASVDGGVVTAVAKGTAVITAASAENGSVAARCTVTVVQPATAVALSGAPDRALNAGEQWQLTASVTPAAADGAVTWTSGDESVATVKNGVVTAIAPGTAAITATTNNNQSAACDITVVKPVTLSAGTATIAVGGSLSLATRSRAVIEWSSSDEAVATVSNGVVTGVSPGTATITAEINGVSTECVVTVAQSSTAVTGIALDRCEAVMKIPAQGETVTLTLSAEVLGGTNPGVTWTSSNDAVATVADGVVTAVAAGAATITAASAADSSIFAACEVAVAGIGLSGGSDSMTAGDDMALTAAVTVGGATAPAVVWQSSDPTVATVANGTVTALHAGEATIAAAFAANPDIRAERTITVSAEASAITLNQSSASLAAGETLTLNTGATALDVTWQSSAPAVATVSNGVVTAVSRGKAAITAALKSNPSVKAACEVVVTEPVTALTLNQSSAAMKPGGALTLTASVEPATANDAEVLWTSSDEAVATVTGGVVTAIAPGTAAITAKSHDNDSIEDTCTVNVISIALSAVSEALTVGDAMALTAAVSDGANADDIAWTVSDSTVVKYESGTATALKAGTAVITAELGGVTAACAVTVTGAASPLTGLKLNRSAAVMAKGSTLALAAAPDGASSTNPAVTWLSSDTAVAAVDADGTVTAVDHGRATVTARSAENPNIAVSCEITVAGIGITGGGDSMTAGGQMALTASVTCGGATAPAVVWRSSDEAVATVDQAGLVTAVGKGTATIAAAFADNDGISAERTISVGLPVAGVALADAALQVGQTLTLAPVVTPSDAVDSALTWASGDTSVASVAGGVVTAKKAGSTTITATAAGGASGTCTLTVYDAIAPVTSVSLSQSSASMKVGGGALSLTASVKPDNASRRDILWTSSDEGVATVSAGKVTAAAAGTATITAASADNPAVAAQCVVTVSAADVPATGVSLSRSSASLLPGQTLALTATVTPDNATERGVTWQSGNAAVAKVENGVVTAVSRGTAKITAASAENGSIKAVCDVTVIQPVTEVALSASGAALTAGETLTLTAEALPANANDRAIQWTSSDAAVAKVENGVVTALKAGTATITAGAADGCGAAARCAVTVSAVRVSVKGMSLNRTAAALTPGGTVTLTPAFTPENPTDGAVAWQSSDAAVAKVENGVVTALKVGAATITAVSADNPAVSADCAVTVAAAAVPATGVSLSRTEAAMKAGETMALTAALSPANVTDGRVVWTSDAPGVAAVKNGAVTAIAEGTANITAAWAGNGAVKNVCRVTVTVPVTRITLNAAGAALTVGDALTLAATVTPAAASNPTVEWTSSAPAVAKVENGKVTALAAGEATITARATDGSGAQAQCSVAVADVSVPVKTIRLSQSAAALKAGETLALTAACEPVDATGGVIWTSSDAHVAAVEGGTVKAFSAGTAVITATAAGNAAVSVGCVVTVTAADVPVTGISLDRTGAAMRAGETIKLTATLSPANASCQTVLWTSGDEAVAAVDQSGVVTAVSSGTAVIAAASAENGAISAVCKVTVTVPVAKLTLNTSGAALVAGQTLSLKAAIQPDGATDRRVIWQSSDEAVATVKDGVVTAVAEGRANITARAADGSGAQAVCAVTVSAPVIPATGMALNLSEASIKIGETLTLTAALEPENVTNQTIKWTSSDEAVATVKDGLVTGVGAGAASITAAWADNPAIRVSCAVTVTRPYVAVTSLSLSGSEAELYIGEGLSLTATVSPADATDQAVAWQSSDPAVAAVSNGRVTALAGGRTTITAVSADNGALTAACEVRVLSDIIAVDTEAAVDAGSTTTLVIDYTGPSGSRPTVQSSDAGIATATLGGEADRYVSLAIRGVAEGAAVLTVGSTGSTQTVRIAVTVNPDPTAPDGVATYRALLIGEENFSASDIATRNRGDVTRMEKMLGSVTGPEGGRYAVTKAFDLDATGIERAIAGAYKGADQDDVSLFFIATHGNTTSTGASAGALLLCPRSKGTMKLGTLASMLAEVPGKVIVIIESCGSGAGVYSVGVAENSIAPKGFVDEKAEARAFDEAVVHAFAAADPGAGGISPKTGEFRVSNKFYVLTASRYKEESYGTNAGPYNFFTKWLTDGIGTSGKMPADADDDDVTTLNELFSYISSVGDNYGFKVKDREGTWYQHVQVYPTDSSYPLFMRR